MCANRKLKVNRVVSSAATRTSGIAEQSSDQRPINRYRRLLVETARIDAIRLITDKYCASWVE